VASGRAKLGAPLGKPAPLALLLLLPQALALAEAARPSR
jgi:hypothetical protein